MSAGHPVRDDTGQREVGPVRTGYGLRIAANPFGPGPGELPDIVVAPALGPVTAEQIVAAVTATDLPDMLQQRCPHGVAAVGACCSPKAGYQRS